MKRGRLRMVVRDLSWIMLILFVLTSNSYAGSIYYYLQIASCRLEENALKFVEKLKVADVTNVVIRREEVPKFGLMHRVYLGPFSSRSEAESRGRDLKAAGTLTTSPFLRKMKSLVLSNLDRQPDTSVKESQDLSKTTRKEIGTREEKPPVQEATETPQVKAEPAPAPPTPSESELKAEGGELQAQQPVEVGTSIPPKEMVSGPKNEPVEASYTKARGRNIPKGEFAIGLQHTYLDIDTVLMERKRITSTTVTDLPIEAAEKNEYPTSMHLDMVRASFGLTDSLELFVNVGGAYDGASSLKPVYGGGARLNLFQVTEGAFRGFYMAFGGEYLAGEVEHEYLSAPDLRWKRETDWNELVGRLEVGLSRSSFAIYGGGTYLRYREDTDRYLLSSSATSFIYQDKLEEDRNFGAFGGVVFYLTPNVPLTFEGNIGNQKSLFGSLQYRF